MFIGIESSVLFVGLLYISIILSTVNKEKNQTDQRASLRVDTSETQQTGQSITALIAWRREEWREESADAPSFEVGNISVQPARQTLVLCQGQPRGDCRETGRSACGSIRVLRCHVDWKQDLEPVDESFVPSVFCCLGIDRVSLSRVCHNTKLL